MVDERSLLVYIMAWCRTDDRPFHKAMVTQFSVHAALGDISYHQLSVPVLYFNVMATFSSKWLRLPKLCIVKIAFNIKF